jgi:glutamine phosphoribosylpyrophosphate amidotransferase
MCGIIYSKSDHNCSVINTILKSYEAQKHRGQEGFGFVAIYKNKVAMYKTKDEKSITKLLKGMKGASEIIFHHRYPTSTPNLSECAHPIKVQNESLQYNYYMVHNGVISNDDDLFDLHSKNGFDYTTKVVTKQITHDSVYETYCYNDSECLAIELAMFIEGKSEGIKASGSIAFVMVQTDKNEKPLAIFYGRNGGSPLKLEKNKGLTTISSESDNVKASIVKDNVIYKREYKSGNVTEIYQDVGVYNYPKVDSSVDYRQYGMGFYRGELDDDNLYNEVSGYEADSYYELMEEEQSLKEQMSKAIKLKDYEAQADIEAELFYVQQGLKDYEKRYNL